jgi:hypothetical protein
VDDRRPVEVWVANDDGTDAHVVARVRGVWTVDWFPSGESLLVSTRYLTTPTFQADERIAEINLSSRTVVTLATKATVARWAPDGRTVYFHRRTDPDDSDLVRGHLRDRKLVSEQVMVRGLRGNGYDGFGVGPCADAG